MKRITFGTEFHDEREFQGAHEMVGKTIAQAELASRYAKHEMRLIFTDGTYVELSVNGCEADGIVGRFIEP